MLSLSTASVCSVASLLMFVALREPVISSSYYRKAEVLSQRWFPPGDICQCLETLLVVTVGSPNCSYLFSDPPQKKKIYTGDFQARLFIRNALNSTLGLLDGNLQWRPPSSLVFYKALPCLRRSVSHLLFRSICAHLVSVNWGYLVVERHPTTCDLIVPGDLCPIHVFLFGEKSKKVVFMV